ncbi:hypothetical protein [Amycolatopsis magusensis]|uniref:Uncharacterized protein n=1 Tax=Amycolatopsis magusensis TaxID=882444 RepID=A0ABS4PVH2_9PSEU|nr:hypothetical protein [Amycolatopsis magusensis]MBP2182843.1 hypothetical protein [Amycolatopsis magusensis]
MITQTVTASRPVWSFLEAQVLGEVGDVGAGVLAVTITNGRTDHLEHGLASDVVGSGA